MAPSVDEILAVIDGARLIIHNATFDVAFLNHEFGRLGRTLISFENVVDTLALARRKHPGSPNNLDALCRRYGINNSARIKHGALLDSELLADVYLRLIGAEQAGLDFAARPTSLEVAADAAKLIRLHPLPPRITTDELAAHAAFVSTLGEKAIWLEHMAYDNPIDTAA